MLSTRGLSQDRPRLFYPQPHFDACKLKSTLLEL